MSTFSVVSVTWLSIDAAIAVVTLSESVPDVWGQPSLFEHTALVGPNGCHPMAHNPNPMREELKSAMCDALVAAHHEKVPPLLPWGGR